MMRGIRLLITGSCTLFCLLGLILLHSNLHDDANVGVVDLGFQNSVDGNLPHVFG
jgi:hypothetical protein